MELTFRQVDVFASAPFLGNPLAVVVGADDLSDEQMAQIANWTNLSETTFLLNPVHPQADYKVRIFTPQRELPFAGHPTLGSAYVWRSLGGRPKQSFIMQECGVGLVAVREQAGKLAFAAPPRHKVGPVSQEDLNAALDALNLQPQDSLDAQWVDNGPGWMAIRMRSREDVLAVRPNWLKLKGKMIGLVGSWEKDADVQFELRAFAGQVLEGEDPVTGSLNASVAQWLIETGIAPQRYVASQGTVLGRAGRVRVEQEGGEIWVGGDVIPCIAGTISL